MVIRQFVLWGALFGEMYQGLASMLFYRDSIEGVPQASWWTNRGFCSEDTVFYQDTFEED